jgi:hypothetical protein
VPLALDHATQQQALWSAAASRAKHSIDLWRSVALVLGIFGAILATLATQVSGNAVRVLSIAAAVALALVTVVLAAKATPAAIQAWTRMRSVSEGVKTEIYLYLTHTPPYRNDADVALEKQVTAITGAAEDLIGETAGISATPKPLPDVTDIDSYIKLRVQQQINGYYKPKGEEAQRRADLARTCVFILALVGAALGGAAGVVSNESATVSLAAWVAVATTVTGAIATHASAARYQQNAITYLQTARQLDAIVTAWEVSPPAEGDATASGERLVQRCEDVISVENQAWMARWNLGADGG